MADLKTIKTELKLILQDGIRKVIMELIKLLPDGSQKSDDMVLMGGRLKDLERTRLRDDSSDKELTQAFNAIRGDILDFINALEEKDFSAEATTTKNSSSAQKGELLYRIPQEMKLEEETKCIVRIAFTEDQIFKDLIQDNDISQRKLNRISELMQVSLLSPHSDSPFEIRGINEPEQMVLEDGYTEWTFYVKPLLEGKHPLIIKVAVIELIHEKERKRELVFEEEIKVTTINVPETVLNAPLKNSKAAFVLFGDIKNPALGNTPESIFKSSDDTGRSPGLEGQTGGSNSGGRNSDSGGSTFSESSGGGSMRKILPMLALLLVAGTTFWFLQKTNIENPATQGNVFVLAEATSPVKYSYEKQTITTSQAVYDVKIQPAQYETVTEQVLSSEASSRIITSPATYETVTEQVLVSKAAKRYNCIEPEYKTEKKEIQVGEEVIRSGNIKPTYVTEQKSYVVIPRTTVYNCTPPIYETFKETYEVTPASTKTIEVPAVYETKIDTIEKEITETIWASPIYEKVEQEIIVEPQSSKWVLHKNQNCAEVNPVDCMVMKEEIIPAVKEKIIGWTIVGCPQGFENDGTKCFRTKVTPPVTRTSQIMVKPRSVKLENIPAKYESRKVRKLVSNGKAEKQSIPAKTATYSYKRLVNRKDFSPKMIRATYKTFKIKTISKKGTYIANEKPAEYKTITKKKVTTQATNKIMEIPASYTTVTKRKVSQAGTSQVIEKHPEKTKVFTTKKIIDKGGKKIKVKAIVNPSADLVRQVQQVLANSDHYKGSITGELNPSTLTALTKYQNEKMLPIGQFDEETMKVMGVKM